MSEAERLAQVLLAEFESDVVDKAAALLRSQAAEIEALRQQIQDNALQQLASEGQWIELTGALRADAERYRWLRDKSVPPHQFYISVPEEFADERFTPSQVDAAIDAARKA